MRVIKLLIAAPKMPLNICQYREDCESMPVFGETSLVEASQFVLDIVTNGYKLPFIAFPQPVFAKNHHSALKHSKFVEEAIGDLVSCVVCRNQYPLRKYAVLS